MLPPHLEGTWAYVNGERFAVAKYNLANHSVWLFNHRTAFWAAVEIVDFDYDFETGEPLREKRIADGNT